MRKDIDININTHDLVLHSLNSTYMYEFKWLPDTDSQVLKGTITLPEDFSESQLSSGISVQIPYVPVYKSVQIQLVKEGDSNPIYNKWMDVKVKMYNTREETVIRASELVTVDINEQYTVQVDKAKSMAYVYSSTISDAGIVDANFQNRDLLLQCLPSNSYRYPISGVGLINYLHSSLEQSGLSERLHSEFEKDGAIVKSASFDSDTGDMNLDLEFINQ